eukprot:scaffold650_cov249-Pinguiococcus_pyrenoidosus.AAC.6
MVRTLEVVHEVIVFNPAGRRHRLRRSGHRAAHGRLCLQAGQRQAGGGTECRREHGAELRASQSDECACVRRNASARPRATGVESSKRFKTAAHNFRANYKYRLNANTV